MKQLFVLPVGLMFIGAIIVATLEILQDFGVKKIHILNEVGKSALFLGVIVFILYLGIYAIATLGDKHRGH